MPGEAPFQWLLAEANRDCCRFVWLQGTAAAALSGSVRARSTPPCASRLACWTSSASPCRSQRRWRRQGMVSPPSHFANRSSQLAVTASGKLLGKCACPFFTNYYFPSPHPLCEVPDLGVGGGRAGSRSPATYGAGGRRGARRRFPFSAFCVFAVCKATVTGALSRPRRSAARTPSRTLSL